jgi:hypothetical protein
MDDLGELLDVTCDDDDGRNFTFLLECEDGDARFSLPLDVDVLRRLLKAVGPVADYVDEHDEALRTWRLRDRALRDDLGEFHSVRADLLVADGSDLLKAAREQH